MTDEIWTEHCGKCGQEKPRDAFYRHSWAPNSLRKPCKECISADRKKRYREKNGSDRSYEQVLVREYGMTLAEYNERLRKQVGRCAVCRRGETVIQGKSGKPRRLSVDHDHVTGAIRGLLCGRCNTVVWALEDNHTTLDAVRRYIEEWQSSFANSPEILKEEP